MPDLTNLIENAKNVVNYVSKPKQVWSDTLDLLRNTTAEIYICAALTMTVGAIKILPPEIDKSHMYPLGFSHREQLPNEGPVSTFYSMNNDAVMKGLECVDDAYKDEKGEGGTFKHRLAFYLDTKTEPTLKQYKYELYQYLDWLPKVSTEALRVLEFEKARLNLAKIENNFDNSWSKTYYDNTHEDCHTEGEGDDEHEECTTVYDDTDYHLRYFKKYGERGHSGLSSQLRATPEIEFKEEVILTKQTEADGEWAAEKSRINGDQLTPEDHLNISHVWWIGSTLNANLPGIKSNYYKLHGDLQLWAKAKQTAHNSDHYGIYDPGHTWPGTPEYQIAQTTINDLDATIRYLDEVIEGIKYTRDQAPKLRQLAKDIVEIELFNSKEGNVKKMERDFISVLKVMYAKNHKEGFNMNRFRYGRVILSLLGLGVAGAAAGKGLDYLGDTTGLYGKGYARRREEDYRGRNYPFY